MTLQISGLGSSHQEAATNYYDLDNNLTQQIDGDNHTSDYNYDSLGNQTQVVVGVGSGNANTTTNSYDGDGNLTLSVNAVNDSTSYAYDAEGDQTLEIDGLGTLSVATTQYKYDAAGNQTEEIDPDGNTTNFQYDADGEQTAMTQAVGTLNATTTYKYDDDGNLTSQSNSNGTSLSMSYDNDGNLTSELWDASGVETNSLHYSYDGNGNILTASNDAGAYTFSYNANGEETQAITPSGATLNYQYDADGNTTEITDSLGDTVTSQYDAEGDLTEQSATGPGSAQVQVTLGYDGDGNMTGITRKGQVSGQLEAVGTSVYGYDAQDDVTSIVHSAGSTTLASYDYNYNAAAQLTQEMDNATTTSYSYDATGQLTSAGSMDYNYDANGNPDNTGYSVGPNNELLSDGTWDYSYDDNDNLIKEVGVSGGPDAGDTWTFGYDPGNEMTSAVEVNGQGQSLVNANYTYDVFGNLYESSVSTNGGAAVVTYFAYNGDTLWLSQTSTDKTLYGAGEQPDQYLFQIDASNGVDWDLNDHLNSVRELMTNSGQSDDNINYNAYGKDVSQSNPSKAPAIEFAGYQILAGPGFDKADGRDYDPETGQWMQQDSILLAGGANDKEYVDDSPTNYTDPTGEYLFSDFSGSGREFENYFYKLGAISVRRERFEGDSRLVFLYSNAQQIKDVIARTKDQSVKDLLSAMMSSSKNLYITITRDSSAAKPTGLPPFVYQETTVSTLEENNFKDLAYQARKSFMQSNYGRLPDDVYPGQYQVDDRQKVAALPPRFNAVAEQRALAAENPDVSEADNTWELLTRENLVRDPERWDAWAAYDARRSGGKGEEESGLAKLLASNEFQQGVRLAGAGLEAVSGALMIVNPFVPGVSQGLGLILIGHALDTAFASGRSLAEGQNVQTYTQKLPTEAALKLGASEETANGIGVVADHLPGLLAVAHDGALLASLVKNWWQDARQAGTIATSQGKRVNVRVVRLTKEQASRVGGCFLAGMSIATESGLKAIEAVQPLEKVWAYDLKAGMWKLCYVSETFRLAYEGELVGVTVAGEEIRGTSGHPYWVLEGRNLESRPRPEHIPGVGPCCGTPGRWVDAGDLQVGDVLLLRDGRRVAVTHLSRWQDRLEVYNLRVEGLECYAVGENGVLVHNNSAATPPGSGGKPAQRELPLLQGPSKRPTQLAPPGTEPLPLAQKVSNAKKYLEDNYKGIDALGRAYPGPTIGGVPTHAHHIVMQVGTGPAGKKAVEESQAILQKFGIDPYTSQANLVWAPNSGYLRTDAYAEKVLEKLKAAKQTKEDIINELKKIGEIVADGRHL